MSFIPLFSAIFRAGKRRQRIFVAIGARAIGEKDD